MASLNVECKACDHAAINHLLNELNLNPWAIFILLEIGARRYQEKGDGELVKMSSGHWVMRHYPGEGSHAHGIVVHTDAKRYVRGVRVLGRSGRIDLDTRPFENSDQVELRSIVWSHLAHKSELEHSIDDAVQLCQSRPKQGRNRG